MMRFAVAAPGAAAALVLGATAASAELTAEQVWSEVRAMMESYGQTVSVGSEERAGDTLTVGNLVLDVDTPDASGSAALDEMRFVERGDGTVEIVLSPEYRIIYSVRPAGADPANVTMSMTHSGLSVIVSGEPEAQTYTYTADAVGLSIVDMTTAGDSVPMTMTMSAEAAAGEYVLRRQDGGRAFESAFRADSATMELGLDDPDTSERASFQLSSADLTSSSSGFMPADTSAADLDSMLKAGFSVSGGMEFGPTTYDFSADVDGATTEGGGTMAGGTFEVEVTPETIVYGTTGRDMDFSMRSSEIPLPEVAFTLAESSFRIEVPATASDEPRAFGLLTAMRGLTVSEGIWALFDPMGALPRDPATVALDLRGQARWLVDIFDPEALAGMASAPGEVESLSLNGLEVSLAGAALTGNGSFSFDNTDLVTFGGMPRPEGAVDLQLVGGNGLLDTLVEMGLVPEEQATGFRMMLGLFARPGDGEDTLVSTIEVNEAGEVHANGQRLR